MNFIDEFKSIAKSVSDAGNHELYAKLQELSKDAYELQIENLELREENRNLKEVASDNASKSIQGECYFFGDQGPFCTRCYDVDKNKVHMYERDTNMGTIYLECPNCKHEVFKEEYSINFGSSTSVPSWDR